MCVFDRSKRLRRLLNSQPTTLSRSSTSRRSVRRTSRKTRRFVLSRSLLLAFSLSLTLPLLPYQESSLNNITRWADILHPTSTSSPPTAHEVAQALGTAVGLRNSGDEKFKARKLAEVILDYGEAIDWPGDALEDEEFSDLLARRAITNLRLCEFDESSFFLSRRVGVGRFARSSLTSSFTLSLFRELPRGSRVSNVGATRLSERNKARRVETRS